MYIYIYIYIHTYVYMRSLRHVATGDGQLLWKPNRKKPITVESVSFWKHLSLSELRRQNFSVCNEYIFRQAATFAQYWLAGDIHAESKKQIEALDCLSRLLRATSKNQWLWHAYPCPRPRQVVEQNCTCNKIVQLELCRTCSGRGMGMNITLSYHPFLWLHVQQINVSFRGFKVTFEHPKELLWNAPTKSVELLNRHLDERIATRLRAKRNTPGDTTYVTSIWSLGPIQLIYYY